MPFPPLTEYFIAERHGGWMLAAMALASLVLTAYLLTTRSPFSAMAWPMLLLGLLELVIGATVLLRAPAQVAALEQGLREAPAQTVAAETQRIAQINRNFAAFRKVEMVLIVVAVAVAAFVAAPSAWLSVALAVLVHASALLLFDTMAQHRAERYVQQLQAQAAPVVRPS